MSSSSKASPEIANEIARLMRDPDALRAEREGMQRPAGTVTTIPTSRVCPRAIPEAAGLRRRDIAAGRNLLSSVRRIRETPMLRLSHSTGNSERSTPDSISTADAPLSRLRTTSAEIRICEISYPPMDVSNSYRRDRPPRSQRPAALDGLSPQPPMPMTAPRAYATISATPARPIIIDFDGKLRVTPVDVRFDRR